MDELLGDGDGCQGENCLGGVDIPINNPVTVVGNTVSDLLSGDSSDNERTDHNAKDTELNKLFNPLRRRRYLYVLRS